MSNFTFLNITLNILLDLDQGNREPACLKLLLEQSQLCISINRMTYISLCPRVSQLLSMLQTSYVGIAVNINRSFLLLSNITYNPTIT